ncbi:TlpA family protein disulfide reductase [Alicyclobacillus shizuokensis]|uniref:TlpA family protein disulfide reductase n=1 Tax=Alicyclobacillus shizuokensis TaxID=392014 RepID=UPI00082BB16B|nr:hypothetical protein [Alicyclobacillus shizuokensis]MCL6625597.1 hypothetical protein [Alicyclobacillus shizuokensis]
MLRWRAWTAWAAALTAAFALAGCQPIQKSSSVPTTFTNRLADEKTTPIAKFDATTKGASLYERVTVYDASGRKVTLDAHKQPLLFEAYWCPHCQRTIVLLHQHASQLRRFPVFVSVGFAKGTTLAQAKRINGQEMRAFGIRHAKVYYLLEGDHGQYSFPTLAFARDGQVELLKGEHTLPVWKQALGATNGNGLTT